MGPGFPAPFAISNPYGSANPDTQGPGLHHAGDHDQRGASRVDQKRDSGGDCGVTLNPEFSGRQKPYLTVREAADLARLATSTVRLYIRKRKLKAQKVGRRVIIARCELEAFLSQNPIDVRFQ